MKYLAILLILALVPNSALAKCEFGEKIIRLGIGSQVGSPARLRAVQNLRIAINLELQGRVCLEILTDDDLFKGALPVTALQAGKVELAAPSTSSLAQFVPDFRVFDLPFAFRDYSAMQRFLVLAGDLFSKSLSRFGVEPLAMWHGSFDQIAAKRPIYAPADVAGLKFIAGKYPFADKFVASLDAVVRPVSAKDRIGAIKSGGIDGQMTSWEQLQQDNTALIHDGVTQTNHAYYGFQLAVSKIWWDGLDPKLKTAITGVIIRVTRKVNLKTWQRQSSAKHAVIRSGAAVRALTQQQRKVWMVQLKPIWDSFENKHLLRLLEQADRAP